MNEYKKEGGPPLEMETVLVLDFAASVARLLPTIDDVFLSRFDNPEEVQQGLLQLNVCKPKSPYIQLPKGALNDPKALVLYLCKAGWIYLPRIFLVRGESGASVTLTWFGLADMLLELQDRLGKNVQPSEPPSGRSVTDEPIAATRRGTSLSDGLVPRPAPWSIFKFGLPRQTFFAS